MTLNRANAAAASGGALPGSSASPMPMGPGSDPSSPNYGGYIAGLVILAIIIIALIAALVLVVLKRQAPAPGLPVTSSSTTNPVYEGGGGKK